MERDTYVFCIYDESLEETHVEDHHKMDGRLKEDLNIEIWHIVIF